MSTATLDALPPPFNEVEVTDDHRFDDGEGGGDV